MATVEVDRPIISLTEEQAHLAAPIPRAPADGKSTADDVIEALGNAVSKLAAVLGKLDDNGSLAARLGATLEDAEAL
eukprot:1919860-Pyramimonas_sp.AAC.1